jgi:hypothetical protein
VGVLSEIYKKQLLKTNKTTWKLFSNDALPFEISSIAKDCMNYVDKNEGTTLDIGIEALEFDSTLTANLNFKS